MSFQNVMMSPTEKVNHMNSLPSSLEPVLAASVSLPPSVPGLQASTPKDSTPRVNKAFKMADFWGPSHSYSYRTSILEFFTNPAD